ncbi:MAG: zinc ribbon domain-containing protein [Kiritimatiellaeota bacterium]|nr:zinc ribbon domain-containing protein [Kiritimatiellota bacterium]
MPLREYSCGPGTAGCAYCRLGFELLETLAATPPAVCPRCGAPVVRRLSAPAVPPPRGMFLDRAKRAGFHQLKRVDRGTYEKQF